nr:MAG TPA: Pre-mRNA-splicing factor 8, Pre-mRNA-splicing factor-mRNA splicing, spliceosome, post-catalytic, P [Caudoviricetes sp.]
MANIVNIADYIDGQDTFNKQLNEKITQVEEELGIDEPLTVLTDDAALQLINQLIDIRDSAQSALKSLNVEESEVLPDGLEF